MTDYEYAALIYCQIFCVENTDGDVYVRVRFGRDK